MGRYELPQIDTTAMGGTPVNADVLFTWGMMYAAGNSVPVDLVIAHKWFNLATMKGHPDATLMRREIAAEMSDAEIGQAQHAAREWLKLNPQPQASPRPVPMQVAA